MSLCSNQGIVTATAHDLGFEYVFTRQLQILASSGNILVSISASGNSPNIAAAIKWAKASSIFTVALTGFDGGAARTLADVSVHVVSAFGDYGVVKDIHLTICHMVAGNHRTESQAHQTKQSARAMSVLMPIGAAIGKRDRECRLRRRLQPRRLHICTMTLPGLPDRRAAIPSLTSSR